MMTLLTTLLNRAGFPDPYPLPELYIRDASTGEAVPVAGIFGWDDEYLQSQSISYQPLNFGEDGVNEDMNEGDETNPMWLTRLSKLIVQPSFSVSEATGKFRVFYRDAGNKVLMSEEYLVSGDMESPSVSEEYLGEVQKLDSLGATWVTVIITEISTGTMNIKLSGI
jgi:hypothetical protein